MLFIHNDVVERLLSMKECMEIQEHAFKSLEDGKAVHRPRIDMYTPTERADGYYRWGTMEGWYDDVFAIRMKSDVITWPKSDNAGWTEEKYCIKPGTFCGLIMLFSSKNGEPLALINDGVLQHMRVGGGAGHRREVSRAEKCKQRGNARFRRNGANLPGSDLRGAHDQALQGVQPDQGAS